MYSNKIEVTFRATEQIEYHKKVEISIQEYDELLIIQNSGSQKALQNWVLSRIHFNDMDRVDGFGAEEISIIPNEE